MSHRHNRSGQAQLKTYKLRSARNLNSAADKIPNKTACSSCFADALSGYIEITNLSNRANILYIYMYKLPAHINITCIYSECARAVWCAQLIAQFFGRNNLRCSECERERERKRLGTYIPTVYGLIGDCGEALLYLILFC